MKTSWKHQQEIAFETLNRAILEDKVSHAYLFEGEEGAPLYEAAIYLAEALLAHHKELPCETCEDCQRVQRLTHGDILLIDGTLSSIKKGDVEELQKQFSQSAVGKYGKKVYIVKNAERATLDAMNSILKFLEEPDSLITAIFLTNAIEKIIPTIRSRCQLLKFQTPSFQEVYRELKEDDLGLDAYIAARIFPFYNYVNQMMSEEAYGTAKNLFQNWCNQFIENQDLALVELQLFIKQEKNRDLVKKSLEYTVKMMKFFVVDCISGMPQDIDSWYNGTVSRYQSENYDFTKMLLIIVETLDKLSLFSVQLTMLVDQMMLRLMEVQHGYKRQQ